MDARFKGRDFLTLMDYTAEEITYFLDTAADFKRLRQRGVAHDYLRGRTAALIFEKKSTRTRTSFQAACAHLGIESFYMRPEEMQLDRGEPIKDTARIIDRYCDALVIRTFGQEIIEEFARHMKNPVINALTDEFHPCQGLADLLTIREKKGEIKGLKVVYCGDIWNVAHTWIVMAGKMGINLQVAYPKGYDPRPQVVESARRDAKLSGGQIVLTQNLDEAVRGADVVIANTWHSMGGPEQSKEQRLQDWRPYQITGAVMGKAKAEAIFMHCMPAYRGEEMTEEVIDGPQSVIIDEGENRMHTEKAVLALLIG